MDPTEKLHVTINEGWVQSHQPGTRWQDADGKEYVVDVVREASPVGEPGMSPPIWVVHSRPAED